MTKKASRLLCLIPALQLLLLGVLGFLIIRRDSHPIEINADSSYWYSGTVKGWQPGGQMIINEDLLAADFDALASQANGNTAGHQSGCIIAFFGPLVDLAQGGYTITVEYSADTEQTMECGSELDAQLRSGTALLPAGNHTSVSFDVLACFPAKAFTMYAEYNGVGTFEIHSVVIRTNSNVQRMLFTAMLALFLLTDAAWLYRRKLRRSRTAVLGVLGVILVTSLPLFADFLAQGHDLRFHLLRIEAVYQGLLRGQFPVRTAPLYYNGLGYAAPVFYCDLLLYFPALLRVMGFPVMTAYQLYILFINTLSAVIGYRCFREMVHCTRTALVMDVCWCAAAYRFSNLYIRAAVGEYSAMAFLPIIALAFMRIYASDNRRGIFSNAALMASGMAMLIMTHVLTTEIVCLILLVLVLVCFRKTFTPKVLLTWLTAVLLTVLLSAWFIVPFLEYYLTVPVQVTRSLAQSVQMMQASGSYVTDLFDFFKNAFALDTSRNLLETPGLTLMAVLAAGMIIAIKEKGSTRRLTITAMILLWMSTNLFPWNALAVYTPLGGLLGMIQFPWRYETAACLVLTLLCGSIMLRLKEKDPSCFRKTGAALAAAAILMTCYYSGTYLNSGEAYNVYSTADLSSTWTSVGEYKRYLPVYGGYEGYGVLEEKRGDAETAVLSSEGDTIVLQVTASEESTVDFSRTNYPYYTVTDDQGQHYTITDSEDCRIRVVVPADFDGTLTLAFQQPLHWRLAELVSLMTLAVMLVYILKKRKMA